MSALLARRDFGAYPEEDIPEQDAILRRLVVTATQGYGGHVPQLLTRLEHRLSELAGEEEFLGTVHTVVQSQELLAARRPDLEQEIADCFSQLVDEQLQLLQKGTSWGRHPGERLSPSVEHIEEAVTLGILCQGLEHDAAGVLAVLNARIGWLLGRRRMTTAENPFRPMIMVQAVYNGWRKLCAETGMESVPLRAFDRSLFLPCLAILEQLNMLLVDCRVLPYLADLPRPGKGELSSSAMISADTERLTTLFNSWNGESDRSGNSDEYGSPAGGAQSGLFEFLHDIQMRYREEREAGPVADATLLRKLKHDMPEGLMSRSDEIIMELLASVFERVLQDRHVRAEIRQLIGCLQIPLAKSALLDKRFFTDVTHPARRLLDLFALAGTGWTADCLQADALQDLCRSLVSRLLSGFDEDHALFIGLAAELEAFLADEEDAAFRSLDEQVARLLQQESLRHARKAAELDVVRRIETGEVPGFVAAFLEKHWVKILTQAHSICQQQPGFLIRARALMDDLIWSVTPKKNAELRKNLLARLPAIAGAVNSWIHALEWDEGERAVFLAKLAKRQAIIAHYRAEASPRRLVEMAVTIAERASRYRMKMQLRHTDTGYSDQFTQMVELLQAGDWLEFGAGEEAQRWRLAWISPQRESLIFSKREGKQAFFLSAEQLAEQLRERRAKVPESLSAVEPSLLALFGPA